MFTVGGVAWQGEIDAWGRWLVAAGRPASTVGLRTYHLRRLGEAMTVGPWEVGGDALASWLGSQSWSAETRRSVRSSLRTFYAWGLVTGRTEVDPSATLGVVKASRPNPRPAGEDVLTRALQLTGPRERLMVRLAAELGLRRGEVAQVHREHLSEGPWGWTLTVHGKGAKVRQLPVSDDLARAVRVACLENGWAFPSPHGGHLSPAHVGKLVSAVLPVGWGMHTLRHRFATRAYAVDTDLLTVMALLGHASPDTTRRYVQVPDTALRRTVLAVAG